MEDSMLHSSSGMKGRKRKQCDVMTTCVDEKEDITLSLPSSQDSPSDRIDPITPAKLSKKKKSGEDRSTSKDISGKRTNKLPLDEAAKLTTFSQVIRSREVVNLKIQVVMLWYKNLYSQTRPKSITFVALDTEVMLEDVVGKNGAFLTLELITLWDFLLPLCWLLACTLEESAIMMFLFLATRYRLIFALWQRRWRYLPCLLEKNFTQKLQ